MRRAFTLVEAIATIAVLSLVVAIVAPNLARVRDGQRRRAVIAALERLPETAKARARDRGEAVALRLEDDAAVLTASWDDTETEIARVSFLGLVSLEGSDSRAATGDATPWEWVVQPDGTASRRDAILSDNGVSWTARFESDGRLRWVSAESTESEEDSWSAGERVERGQ